MNCGSDGSGYAQGAQGGPEVARRALPAGEAGGI